MQNILLVQCQNSCSTVYWCSVDTGAALFTGAMKIQLQPILLVQWKIVAVLVTGVMEIQLQPCLLVQWKYSCSIVYWFSVDTGAASFNGVMSIQCSTVYWCSIDTVAALFTGAMSLQLIQLQHSFGAMSLQLQYCLMVQCQYS